MSVTSVKWGGNGLIYSSSQDRTIKIWNDDSVNKNFFLFSFKIKLNYFFQGTLKQTLEGHAHWVNSLTLSTDYALRIAFFEPGKKNLQTKDDNEKKKIANQIYLKARGEGERLVSGSDDFTLHLWLPETNNKPVGRLTGHMQLVNDVKFSPDTRLIASASFDKSIKLWDGKTGK